MKDKTIEDENIKSVEHYGNRFFWSSSAIDEKIAIIGFYFDKNGIPMVIVNGSEYYYFVINYDKEIRGKM